MTEKEKIRSLQLELEKLKEELCETNAFLESYKSTNSKIDKSHDVAQEESNITLDTIINNLQGVVYRCRNDRDWTMEYISKGIIDLTGYPSSDFINNKYRSFNSIVHSEDRKSLWKRWQTALDKRDYFAGEYRIITANGNIRWVWERGCGIYENDQLVALEGFISDITETKKSVIDLQEKEELLQLVGDMAKVGGWEFDVRTMEGNWTDEVARIHDMEPNDPTNVKVGLSFYTESDRPIIEKAIQDAVEKGIPYDLELQLVTEKGNRKWVRTKGIPVYEKGKVVLLKGIFQDITQRKEALLLLEDEKLRLKTLIKTIPDMVWLKDPNGVYITCNPRFERFFGASETEIKGKTDYDFMDKELADFFRQKDKEAIVANEPKTNMEWVTYADDGHKEFLETIKTPMYDSQGKLIGVLGIARDITEKFENEQELLIAKEKAEESDKLKTAFLQNMSHEIRTPMNAIMGFSELLPDVFDDKDQLKHYSEIIENRSADLLRIIDGILDIARIESGLISVFPEKCNLVEWFSELKLIFSEQQKSISKEYVNLKFNCEAVREEEEVVFDMGKTKQILINLINNAFKFTEKGKIEIGCQFKGEKQLLFYVSDSGSGIKKEDQELIFERFAQINPTSSKVHGGTGLGLAIVKGMLDSIGGKIWIESEVGEGSTFYFTIPFELE